MKKIYKVCLLVAGLFVGTQVMNAQTKLLGEAVKYDNSIYYVLWDTNVYTMESGGVNELDLDAPGALVTFQADKSMSTAVGKLALAENGSGSYVNIWSKNPDKKNNYTDYSATISNFPASKIKFYTINDETWDTFSYKRKYTNIKVTMASDMSFTDRTKELNLVIPEGKVGVASSNTFDFLWSNLGEITISSSDSELFKVNISSISDTQGKYGRTTVTVTCSNDSAGTHKGVITISGGGKTIQVNVSSTVTKHQATIDWNEKIADNIPIDEVIENAVSTKAANVTLTLTSSDENILKVEGTTVTAVGAGEAKLTASIAETNNFYGVIEERIINVDNKERQVITWEQNLTVVPTTTATIELDASTNSGLPLTYTSSNPEVAMISGNILTIVGTGNTNVKVYAEGNDTYFPAYMTKGMTVYDPAFACPDVFLYDGEFQVAIGAMEGDKSHEINWEKGKEPATLSFSAKSGNQTFFDSSNKTDITISQKIDGSWSEIQKVSVTNASVSTFSYSLNRQATDVRFYVDWNENGTTVDFSNVEVKQLRYLETETKNIAFNPLNLGAIDSKEITLNYSALASMCGIYMQKGKVFSVTEGITFGEGCGSVGTKTFAVNFSSQGLTAADCATYEDTILIINSQSETVLRIPVIGTVEQLRQSISWTPTATTISTIDKVTVPTTTSAGLPIAYTSSDSTIAYVNEAYELVIVKYGAVTITANAAGDNTYQAAKAVAHTFTINPAAYTVTITEVATVEAGTTLADITLEATATDEAGNIVEGNLAWADGTIVPVAGTTAEYDVVFTPVNTSYYAATTHNVSVSVNKRAHTIAWEQETTYTMIDVISLTATSSAGIAVTYTSLNEEVATVNEDNTLTLHQAGDVTIQATAAGNAEYHDALAVDKTFTISLLEVTLAPAELDAVLVGTKLGDITPSGTATDANGAEVVGSWAFAEPETIPAAGTATHKVIFTPTDAHIYAVAEAEVSLDVNKHLQAITWEQETTIKTIDIVTLNAISSAGIAVTYTSLNEEVATVNEDNTLTLHQAGDVTIQATAAGNDEYLNAPTIEKTFVITLSSVTLTTNTLEAVTIGTKLGDITLTGNAKDANNTDVAGTWIFVTPDSIPTAGTANYKVLFIPENSNIYAPAETEVSLTVNKKSQTITWNPTTELKTIDQVIFDATTDAEGLVVTYSVLSGDAATVSESGELTIVTSGEVTITVSVPANDIYAAAEPISKTFVISKTDLELTTESEYKLEQGKALSTIELLFTATDIDINEVEGETVFVHADSIPTEIGVQAFEVLFTPTNLNYYDAKTITVYVNVIAGENGPTTDVIEVEVATPQVQKIWKDGMIYVIRDDEVYSIMGNKVK